MPERLLAATMTPGEPDSPAVSDVGTVALRSTASGGDGRTADGAPVVVDGVLAGVCATDREVIRGGYHGQRLTHPMVALHESLGRVRSAPSGGALAVGDLVAGIVREPCTRPDCLPCRSGEEDLCVTGEYLEHGISGVDGFGAQRWSLPAGRLVRLDPSLTRAGVLVEPMSVVCKAFRQIDLVASRSTIAPRTALIIGAGPIGLLAALVAATRGLTVHVTDIVEDGIKPDLVAALGATYHRADVDVPADIVIDAVGVVGTTWRAIAASARNSITALLGFAHGRFERDVHELFGPLIGGNRFLFGSINAARTDWDTAAATLAHGDVAWAERLITRVVPLAGWTSALDPGPGDVKVAVDLAAG